MKRFGLLSACALLLFVSAGPAAAQFAPVSVLHNGTIGSGGTGDVDVVAWGGFDGVGLDAFLDFNEMASHTMTVTTPGILVTLEDIYNYTPEWWYEFEFEISGPGFVIVDWDVGPALADWSLTSTGHGQRLWLEFVNPIANGGGLLDLFSLDIGGSGMVEISNTPIGRSVVPEPSTLAVLGIGLVAFGLRRRRRV